MSGTPQKPVVNDSGTCKHSTLSLIQQSQTSTIAPVLAGMTYSVSIQQMQVCKSRIATFSDAEKFQV